MVAHPIGMGVDRKPKVWRLHIIPLADTPDFIGKFVHVVFGPDVLNDGVRKRYIETLIGVGQASSIPAYKLYVSFSTGARVVALQIETGYTRFDIQKAPNISASSDIEDRCRVSYPE